MTRYELSKLSVGDIVQGSSGHIYVVTGNYGGHVTAVKTVDITNPGEWTLVQK